ncbi:nucleotide sugar dehydrogenase [Sphingomonas sp. GC_Shp_1]|uniref:nucleotide sugar dehydrogenase n=2 Tax=unclassified Sphingomonas TaxID=196159 RepID=UPI00226BA015|nr:nucleotide sugar dehydrogenase [Sphingomonas sp. GC_Shp_1]
MIEHTVRPRVLVVGLGYVGLPLAVALAKHFPTTGLDINERRIAALRAHDDATGEIDPGTLAASSLRLISSINRTEDYDIFVVTVPTPVDADNLPDLSPVKAASSTVAAMLKPGAGAIVVYESTVYPGVTEDLCGPLLEQESGLTCGRDFFLGYSPERINPGDREHTVDRIVKVVAGQTADVTERLAALYGAVTSAGVFRARSIKAAEAAKVIENAQRDINIAFMNEIAQIFARLNLSVWDVLAAAQTKWNFLPFQPGLVGGHCIGVDPYYLSHLSQQLGHEPNVILSGRAINDGMADWIAGQVATKTKAGARVLVLGMTFKEDVPDIRNSKCADLVHGLEHRGLVVSLHDPLANAYEVMHEYGFALAPDALAETYDAVICAVPHAAYRNMNATDIAALVGGVGLVADLKGAWRHLDLAPDVTRWSL